MLSALTLEKVRIAERHNLRSSPRRFDELAVKRSNGYGESRLLWDKKPSAGNLSVLTVLSHKPIVFSSFLLCR